MSLVLGPQQKIALRKVKGYSDVDSTDLSKPTSITISASNSRCKESNRTKSTFEKRSGVDIGDQEPGATNMTKGEPGTLKKENIELEEHKPQAPWKKRQAALEEKIKWVKEEITALKKQDQSLMRQFLDLRAIIHQLRPLQVGSMKELAEDSSSDEEPMYSTGSSSNLSARSPLAGDPDFPVFRARTSSMLLLRTPPSSKHTEVFF